jgi:hypothetical protein
MFEMSLARGLSKRLTTGGQSQTLETEKDYGAIHCHGNRARRDESVLCRLPARLRAEYYGHRQSMTSI